MLDILQKDGSKEVHIRELQDVGITARKEQQNGGW